MAPPEINSGYILLVGTTSLLCEGFCDDGGVVVIYNHRSHHEAKNCWVEGTLARNTYCGESIQGISARAELLTAFFQFLQDLLISTKKSLIIIMTTESWLIPSVFTTYHIALLNPQLNVLGSRDWQFPDLSCFPKPDGGCLTCDRFLLETTMLRLPF
jgi:hypothetical protein